jgi:hypothetical protein
MVVTKATIVIIGTVVTKVKAVTVRTLLTLLTKAIIKLMITLITKVTMVKKMTIATVGSFVNSATEVTIVISHDQRQFSFIIAVVAVMFSASRRNSYMNREGNEGWVAELFVELRISQGSCRLVFSKGSLIGGKTDGNKK